MTCMRGVGDVGGGVGGGDVGRLATGARQQQHRRTYVPASSRNAHTD